MDRIRIIDLNTGEGRWSYIGSIPPERIASANHTVSAASPQIKIPCRSTGIPSYDLLQAIDDRGYAQYAFNGPGERTEAVLACLLDPDQSQHRWTDLEDTIVRPAGGPTMPSEAPPAPWIAVFAFPKDQKMNPDLSDLCHEVAWAWIRREFS